MATIERDVVLTTKTADGGTAIDLPITRLGNIEHTSADKTELVNDDLIPLFDSKDANEAKKISFADLITSAKSKLGSVYAALAHTHKVDDVTGLSTQLSNKADGRWTFYQDLSELDITAEQETIEEIARALPDCSEISYVVNTTRDLYPVKYGMCTVRRLRGHRTAVLFHDPGSGLCWTGKLYLPNTPAWNGWVPLAAAVPPTWYNIAPTGGYSVGTGGLRYCKDGCGTVHLNGTVKKASSPASSEIFLTMPAGFRPAAYMSFVAAQLSGESGAAWSTVCVVQPNGVVRFYGGAAPAGFSTTKDLVFAVSYPAAG